jgi:hypothetical protein
VAGTLGTGAAAGLAKSSKSSIRFTTGWGAGAGAALGGAGAVVERDARVVDADGAAVRLVTDVFRRTDTSSSSPASYSSNPALAAVSRNPPDEPPLYPPSSVIV